MHEVPPTSFDYVARARLRVKERARLLLLSAFALSGCGTSLVVAEQSKEVERSDGGLPRDAGGPPIDMSDAVPEVVTVCGNSLCTNRVATVADTQVIGYACCVDPHRSLCGIVEFGSTCSETDQEGKLDPNCFLPLGAPVDTFPGCCRPDGKCGVFESTIGLGCMKIPIWSELTSCTY